MTRPLPLRNSALFLLLTSAIAACGSSGTVLESGADTGAPPAPGADGGDAAASCCPPAKSLSGSMYLGGKNETGCFKTNDFFCSTNWRIEKDSAGCDVWRYDARAPGPGENAQCFTVDGG